MHVLNPRYVQRWRLLSVSHRFHSGFIVGFIVKLEKVIKRRFRAKREVPQRIKVGASFRFHTGFIVGFIPKSASMTKWRFRALPNVSFLKESISNIEFRKEPLPNLDFLKEYLNVSVANLSFEPRFHSSRSPHSL